MVNKRIKKEKATMTQSLLEELKAVANKRIGPLLEKREKLQKELEALDKEISTAQRAMDALEGKTPAAKSEKKKRKNSKPSASPEKVLAVLKAELKRGGGKMSKADLVAAVKEKLSGDYGLTGLKQRAEKLIAEKEEFAVKGNSVSLSAKGK
ncbi:hypothetical protein MalM25_23930 [Planctomycetes bacterium MalM25]|nr:hypothetical protein MalM25_23930 [Planctomycetes bacterium MalM25]